MGVLVRRVMGEHCAAVMNASPGGTACHDAHAAPGDPDPDESPDLQNRADERRHEIVFCMSAVLPIGWEESDLRALMQAYVRVSAKWDAVLARPRISSSEGVERAVIYLETGLADPSDDVGYAESGGHFHRLDDQESVVMIGHAGASGTSFLSQGREGDLKKRFSAAYVCRMQDVPVLNPQTAEAIMAPPVRPLISHLFPIGEGGVYAALWYMCEEMNSGITVRLADFPIHQETVELCNYLDLDPYKLDGGGSFLAVTDQPDGLTEALGRMEVRSAVIGRLTHSRDRVILKEDETRYVTKPDMDELIREN